MERVTFSLGDGTGARLARRAALESLSSGRRVSASELVRRALAAWEGGLVDAQPVPRLPDGLGRDGDRGEP